MEEPRRMNTRSWPAPLLRPWSPAEIEILEKKNQEIELKPWMMEPPWAN